MSNLKKDLFVGIDIGANAIKAVVLSRAKGKRLHLLRSVYVPYDNFVEYGDREQSDKLSVLLKKIIRKQPKLKNVGFGVSVSCQSAFVRLLRIPVTAIKKLRQIVLYETQQQVPFPINDVVWDFQICGRDEQELIVLLSAVKKEFILSILKAAKKVGVRIDFIDVSSLSLYNCLQYFFKDLEQTLILDIGAKTTDLIIVNSGSIWTRSLPIGGEYITEAIAKKLNISRKKAEELKKDKGKILMLYYGTKTAKSANMQKIAETITNVLTDLTNEIVKTLNFYNSQHKSDLNIRKILLAGGVSKTENISKFFTETLSIQAETIDYFNFITMHQDVNVEDNEFLGVPLGLGIRGVGRSTVNINLLPQEELRIRDFQKRRPFILIVFICLLLIVINCSMFVFHKYYLSKQYFNALTSKIIEYKHDIEEIKHLESVTKDGDNRIKTMAKVFIRKYETALIVQDIIEAIPSSVWLENLSIDLNVNTVVLTGNCETGLETIGTLQDNLEEKSIFDSADLDILGKAEQGMITFSLTITLNPIKLKYEI
ncbi:MAG: hypothetical protein DRP78_00425 [Candidatus Omnitrophota bacterium]|nr:MAG: hypothetical protein DRP78_00425 [Candidatus Omnitrophota bacterium]